VEIDANRGSQLRTGLGNYQAWACRHRQL